MKIPKFPNKLRTKLWKLNKIIDDIAGEYKTESYPTATGLQISNRFGNINPYVKRIPKKWKVQGVPE